MGGPRSKKKKKKKNVYEEILGGFSAPVVDLDCGRKCSHLNGGVPVCCDTSNAVPIMNRAEWKLLKGRSDLWRKFKPSCQATRDLVASLGEGCLAVECKGAKFCERDNRSLSCRAFPFFPYIDRNDELLGLGYYWTFEDRCWVISNLAEVRPDFVREFLRAYDRLFEADPEERQVFRDYSATMRRVFSRKGRDIYLIAADGGFLKVKPKGRGMVPVKKKDLPAFEPYSK